MDYVDYCDLMSRDLYEHIREHEEGPEFLQWLYSSYARWESDITFKQHQQSEAGKKRAQVEREQRQAAEEKYLQEAEILIRRRPNLSMADLSRRLERRGGDEAWKPALTADTIRRYLREHAEQWHIHEAQALIRSDPDIGYDELAEKLVRQAEDESKISVRKPEEVQRYLRMDANLWYLRRALQAQNQNPEISVDDLVDVLVKAAVQEEGAPLRDEPTVREILTKLGIS